MKKMLELLKIYFKTYAFQLFFFICYYLYNISSFAPLLNKNCLKCQSENRKSWLSLKLKKC